MANGKAHTVAATGIIILYVVAASVLIGMAVLSPIFAIILSSGFVLGIYANPDVRDQEHVRNHGEHLVDKHFGKFAGLLWTVLWYRFAKLIPHRSPFSHLPLFATGLAWLWLFGAPLALVWLYLPTWFDVAFWLALWTLPGWVVQDVVHLVQDGGLKAIRW